MPIYPVPVPVWYDGLGNFLNNAIINIGSDSMMVGTVMKPSHVSAPPGANDQPLIPTLLIRDPRMGAFYTSLTATQWQSLLNIGAGGATPPAYALTGGFSVTQVLGKSIVAFNSGGTIIIYRPIIFDLWVIGGGGAGGAGTIVGNGLGAGGGGAGGLIQQNNQNLGPGTYNVTVGLGAPGVQFSTTANSGGNSSFMGFTAFGGGGGGMVASFGTGLENGAPGGCGGGGGYRTDVPTNGTGGTGISGQSTTQGTGGNGSVANAAGGGGGGTGGVGANSPSAGVGGAGGAGQSFAVFGPATLFAAGGGAGKGGLGGSSGAGGNGATASTPATNGTTPGSGGGGGQQTSSDISGAGANGIVILRIPNTF
jgi:hypothetical protein